MAIVFVGGRLLLSGLNFFSHRVALEGLELSLK
jgi:hypothetical protein